MTPYTVHDADGRILRSGICQEEVLDKQAGAGEFVLPILSKDDKHYVDVDSGILFPLPISPDPTYTFDYKSKKWLDNRSLDALKDAKWAEIKKARTSVEFGQFSYKGMVFDGDVDAQRRLGTYISVSKSAIAAGTPFQAEFILADNTVVTLQAEDFVAIELTKANQVAEAFTKAAGLRQSIYSAQSSDELSRINWI